MPTLTDPDADKKYAPKVTAGEHESMGIHPERAEAEAADLENQFAADSAPEATYGQVADNKQLRASEEGGGDENPMNFTGGKNIDNGKRKARWWTKKKAATAGIGSSILVGGGLLGLSFMPGLIELPTLAHALMHPFSKQQSDSNSSQRHWTRSLRAVAKGDYRYTRVGAVGSKMADSLLSDFKTSGITFGGSDVIGNPETITIDQQKFAKATNDEAVRQMTKDEFKEHIKNTYGIEINKNNTASLATMKTQSIGKLTKNLRSAIGQEGPVGWLKGRSLNKFLGIKTIFHPIDAAATNKLRKAMSPEEAFEKTANQDLEESTTKTAAAAEEVRSATGSSLVKVANWTTIGQGAVYGLACTMVYGGKAIVVIDRMGTVMPSIIEAMKLVGLYGEQQAGDLSAADLGGVMNSLTATKQSDIENGTHDAGTTVWEGGALGILAGNVTPNKNGDIPNDITIEHKGAFDPPSVKILEGTGNGLAKAALGPVNIATYLTGNGDNPCGLVGMTGLALEGVAIQLGLAIGAVFTGGADEAAAQSAGAAARIAVQNLVKQMVNKVAVAKALGFGTGEALAMQKIQKVIVDSNAAKALAASAFRGAQGGNLLAYGARASANLVSASSGGIALVGTTTKTLLGSAGQEDQQQFLQKNFFARMFSLNDNRSLLGHLATDVSPSFSTNISTLFTSVLGINSSISHSFGSLFTHGTFADSPTDSYSGNYDWGFPQFGLPDNLLNADDPPANAEALGQYLTQVCPGGPSDGKCGSDGDNGGYTARIKACFGNDLTQTGGLWDVSPAQAPSPSQPVDIDPGSENYQNANCGNGGDIHVCSSENDTSPGCIWGRIMLFTNDMGTLKAMACVTVNTSCSDIGAPGGSDSTTTTAPPSSGVSGDAKTLAQKLLDEAAAGKVVLTDSTKSDLQKTVQGQQVYIGDSAQGGGKCTRTPAIPTSINATLLQVLLNISATYQIKIQNIVSGHPCDTLKHSTGHASDIFQINGSDLNDAWWAKPDAITITNNIAKIEHDTDPSNAFGLGVGCSAYGKITAPSNITVFSDNGNFADWNTGCSGAPKGQNEIHVDVRGG